MKRLRYPNQCHKCKHFNISQNPYAKNPLKKTCDWKWSKTGDYEVSMDGKCNTFERKIDE